MEESSSTPPPQKKRTRNRPLRSFSRFLSMSVLAFMVWTSDSSYEKFQFLELQTNDVSLEHVSLNIFPLLAIYSIQKELKTSQNLFQIKWLRWTTYTRCRIVKWQQSCQQHINPSENIIHKNQQINISVCRDLNKRQTYPINKYDRMKQLLSVQQKSSTVVNCSNTTETLNKRLLRALFPSMLYCFPRTRMH